MSDTKDSGNFLHRWSVRKQHSAQPVSREAAAFAADTTLSDLAICADATNSHDADHLQNVNPETVEQSPALLTDADMPDVETLTASSDISAFLGKGVSAALRKAALRHVFRQPQYNVRDGLDDYDDDYTVFEPLGDTVTSDMKFHAARKEQARRESERLAQVQMEKDLETSYNTEAAQDGTANIENRQPGESFEEKGVADHAAVPEAEQEHRPSEVAVEGDAGQGEMRPIEEPSEQHPDAYPSLQDVTSKSKTVMRDTE